MHHGSLVPRLTDGVVVLDAHRGEDVAAHLAGEDEETAHRFGWWPERSTPETVITAFNEWSDDWALQRSRRAFAIRSALDQHLVGGCELRIHRDGASGEVSYWTHADARGRGFASRGLVLLVDYAWSVGVRRLESHIEPDNLASKGVSERAGFSPKEGFVADGREMLRYVVASPSPET
jgi:RimJ/RimL family protein N-acetyltransferase